VTYSRRLEQRSEPSQKGKVAEMNRKQFLLTLSVAIISGFLGGTLGVWFLMPQLVLVQEDMPKVIEAQEFRVVDSKGIVRISLDEKGLDFLSDGEWSVSLTRRSLRFQKTGSIEWGEYRPSGMMATTEDRFGFSLMLAPTGGASLRLVDHGIIRAALGTIELIQTDTGSTEIRAPSSLVLLDDKGKVLWSAP